MNPNYFGTPVPVQGRDARLNETPQFNHQQLNWLTAMAETTKTPFKPSSGMEAVALSAAYAAGVERVLAIIKTAMQAR